MATGPKNTKSQSLTARIPHDVMEAMESVKQDGESNAGFIVTAMRGEIARRQAEGSGKDPLVSSLDALARVEQIGKKAAAEIGEIIDVARNELQQRGIEPKG
ncbi:MULTISPECIES: YlcI/YnfO family protein [Klebsiella]|uniref:YlcI/YnfO family protein n=1 Tax=Klebsiella TaxID=570 RepID=UPI000651151E|nr:YlcI/YnfO family protein [Klebsiella pneumoniae]KMB43092.1 hypothetical protein SL56_02908 [Klebsiella pneumoniae]MBD0937579.1 hypothetical protein [Klebsiella pneumoniae]MBS2892524.1 hypothetical protein [Klebsiella pneumoniae]MBX9272414.1 hypothetical protein [Klebsiella pneumoniae]MCA4973504.1 hypothetical protein [Klebsiella pneumoniae]